MLYFTISSYILHKFSFCLEGLEISRSKLNSTFADWIKSEHRLSEKPVLEKGRPHVLKAIQKQNLLSIITSWLRRGRKTQRNWMGVGMETVGSLGHWLGSPAGNSFVFSFLSPYGGRCRCCPGEGGWSAIPFPSCVSCT